MGEGRTGEPQANHERLTVAQAAAALGLTEGAVRSRIKRGTLPTTKEDGTVYVLLGDGTSTANQTPNAGVLGDQSGLITSLQDQVRYLREQLDAEREARTEERRRHDTVVAQLTSRIPAIKAPPDEQASSEASSVSRGDQNASRQTVSGSAEQKLMAENSSDLRLSLANFLPSTKPRLSRTYYVVAIFLSAAIWVWGASTLPGPPLLTFAPLLFGFWIGLRRSASSKGPYIVSTVLVGVLVPILMSAVISFMDLLYEITPAAKMLGLPFEYIPKGWGYYGNTLDPTIVFLLLAHLLGPALLFLSGNLLGESAKRWRNSRRRDAWMRTGESMSTAPADVDPNQPNPTVVAAYWAFAAAIVGGLISAIGGFLTALVQGGAGA